MIIDTLTEIVYLYYPKNISNLNDKEKYLRSNEYLRLESRLTEFANTITTNETYITLLKNFELNNFTVHDVSVLQWQDRCISFEINNLIGNNLTKICIQISVLIPYFNIYAIEAKIDTDTSQYLEYPIKIDLDKNISVGETVSSLSNIIANTTKFSRFPNEILDLIILGISFNDIDKGSFTFYNAFFLNNYLYDTETIK